MSATNNRTFIDVALDVGIFVGELAIGLVLLVGIFLMIQFDSANNELYLDNKIGAYAVSLMSMALPFYATKALKSGHLPPGAPGICITVVAWCCPALSMMMNYEGMTTEYRQELKEYNEFVRLRGTLYPTEKLAYPVYSKEELRECFREVLPEYEGCRKSEWEQENATMTALMQAHNTRTRAQMALLTNQKPEQPFWDTVKKTLTAFVIPFSLAGALTLIGVAKSIREMRIANANELKMQIFEEEMKDLETEIANLQPPKTSKRKSGATLTDEQLLLLKENYEEMGSPKSGELRSRIAKLKKQADQKVIHSKKEIDRLMKVKAKAGEVMIAKEVYIEAMANAAVFKGLGRYEPFKFFYDTHVSKVKEVERPVLVHNADDLNAGKMVNGVGDY